MKIETKAFAEAIKLVDNVPANPAIITSQFVKLEAKGGKLRVRLSGLLSAQVAVPCEGELDCFVDRRALAPFLERAGDSVLATKNEEGLLLKSGRASVTVAISKAPEAATTWAPGKGQKLKLEGKHAALLLDYAKPDAGNSHLEFVVYQKGYGAFATDSISMAAVLDKTVELGIKIPRQLAEFLPKLPKDGQHLWVEKTGMAICWNGGWVFQPLSAGAKEYPDVIQQILDKARTEKSLFKVAPSILLEGLTHINGFTWASIGATVVHCEMDEKRVQLSLQEKTVTAVWGFSVTVVGKPAKWNWSLSQIYPWLKKIGDQELMEYGTMKSPVGSSDLQWVRSKDAEGRVMLLVMVGLG
jgi:hypothetical protein